MADSAPQVFEDSQQAFHLSTVGNLCPTLPVLSLHTRGCSDAQSKQSRASICPFSTVASTPALSTNSLRNFSHSALIVAWYLPQASDPGETGADPHGLAREGLFYSQWRSLCPPEVVGTLAAVLPDVYHSEGNMERGTKLILLEDLSDCVQCGYFFGPGNPNNWGKDLTAATKGVSLSVSAATALSFAAAARLHAPFWQSEALVKSPDLGWLRAGAWARGESRETWEASQTRVRTLWTAAKDKMGGGEVEWDPLLVACVDASVEKATWAAFQSELKTRPFTLVHGDFHPANIMVRSAGGVQSVALLDWEVVGVGSGPQDLGQFMLSHVDPATRKEIERGAVEAYHAELVKLNPAVAMTMEECWREYIDGGLGRWLWLLPLLVSMCPPPMVKFFVAQVHAFIVDHGVTPQSVPMPRA